MPFSTVDSRYNSASLVGCDKSLTISADSFCTALASICIFSRAPARDSALGERRVGLADEPPQVFYVRSVNRAISQDKMGRTPTGRGEPIQYIERGNLPQGFLFMRAKVPDQREQTAVGVGGKPCRFQTQREHLGFRSGPSCNFSCHQRISLLLPGSEFSRPILD